MHVDRAVPHVHAISKIRMFLDETLSSQTCLIAVIVAVQMSKHAAAVEELQGSVKEAQDAATQLNAQEAIFGLPPTDYSHVKKLADALEPFHQFWTSADRCDISAHARKHL